MLDRFYPIVPDIVWLTRIVPLGVKTVQLRIKNFSDDGTRRQIREALDICRRHDCQLIVNDYWSAAIDLGADYIHLGQEDLAGANLAAIRQAGIRIGISTHSHEELDIALAAEPDYVALGPIFETKLKKMKWAPQGLARISDWKARIDCPLVAIGGLTVELAAEAFAAGADSLAVVTDFITHADPEMRVRQWLSVTGNAIS
jgi:thiamine-phosphate pyrophosphorylase